MMRVITTCGKVIKQKDFNIKMMDNFLLQFYEYKNATFLHFRLQQDSVYEVASISCNVAFWYMKHASVIASKDE